VGGFEGTGVGKKVGSTVGSEVGTGAQLQPLSSGLNPGGHATQLEGPIALARGLYVFPVHGIQLSVFLLRYAPQGHATYVGSGVGTNEGSGVGTTVGSNVGTGVGTNEGAKVGKTEGCRVGASVGPAIGLLVGGVDGSGVGDAWQPHRSAVGSNPTLQVRQLFKSTPPTIAL